jgi:hypothetical protein
MALTPYEDFDEDEPEPYVGREDHQAPVYEDEGADLAAASDYDAQGGYGSGYPPPYVSPDPDPTDPVNYYEDGSIGWAGDSMRQGRMTTSTDPTQESWIVQPEVESTAMPYPDTSGAWYPNGPLQDSFEAPLPYPDDIDDYYEDEDLAEY